ncbi:permease [Acetobacterium woodii]|uniref:Putative membrane protein n=1 Tax=Acetobacterium woodii (strain ATCC 29683 / DSM 1030 / JCM 2381 / KCTC 1655 / WB1) TaxID=931626 RepID=H6LJ61_ACEWD|nr:permease [Acetobacterium woodii]AFA47424.1 putative membrane protein [Acetobacterium woodii DSM 1030]
MSKNKMALFKRYRFFIFMLIATLIILLFKPALGLNVYHVAINSVLQMLGVLPPIFILIGLLDVWVDKETMVKYMGKDSGIVGILLGFFLGSAAAGPLYAVFPVAGVFINKGSRLANVFIIVGAWASMKIPLLLFEVASMGLKFTIIRFIMDVFGVLIIAFVMEKLLTQADEQEICQLSKKMVE